MGKCEVCGNSGDTSEVTIGDKSSGKSKSYQMCPECAVKGAIVVKAAGGEVRFIERSSGSKTGGCLSVLVGVAAVVGVVLWLLY